MAESGTVMMLLILETDIWIILVEAQINVQKYCQTSKVMRDSLKQWEVETRQEVCLQIEKHKPERADVAKHNHYKLECTR